MLGEAGLPESRLVIAGPLDGDDFRVIREVFTTPGGKPSLDFLDISGVSICEGGGFYDGHRHTECDVITSGLFAGLDRLTGIVLPMTAVTVMRDAFSVTPLVSLSIPPGVRDVLPSADCAMLESVEVSPGNRFFRSVEGVLYDAEITRIVWFPQAKKGEYVIPSTVRSIGEYAFRNTSVTSLVIPDGVTDISRGAFSGSALTSIIIPPGLTNIAEGLFQDCPSLICLHLGAATEYIGAYAFDGAPLRELQLEAEFPPVVKAETFSSSSGDLFDTCVLKVPYSSIPLYRNHKYWGRFSTIKSL